MNPSSHKQVKTRDQELKANQFANHQHIDINNNKKTVVTFGTHKFEPLNMFIWFKRVKTRGKKAVIYYKEKPHYSWKKAPKGCPVMTTIKSKEASQCSDGQRLGKALARTIAYMAIMQGKELSKDLFSSNQKWKQRVKATQGNSGSTPREKPRRKKKVLNIEELMTDEEIEKIANYKGDISKKIIDQAEKPTKKAHQKEPKDTDTQKFFKAKTNYQQKKNIHKKLKNRSIDMDEVSDAIRNAVRKTAKCVVKGFSTPDQNRSVKKVCLVRAMIKESNSLIEDIIEGAVLHGFKCDYEALKKGKCRLSKVDRAVKDGDELLKTLDSINSV